MAIIINIMYITIIIFIISFVINIILTINMANLQLFFLQLASPCTENRLHKSKVDFYDSFV